MNTGPKLGYGAGLKHGMLKGAAEERARIVAWLTSHAWDYRSDYHYRNGEDAVRAAAAEIEAGEHAKEET